MWFGFACVIMSDLNVRSHFVGSVAPYTGAVCKWIPVSLKSRGSGARARPDRAGVAH